MAGSLDVEVQVQTYKRDFSLAQELTVQNLFNERDIVQLTFAPDGTNEIHKVQVSAGALTDALRRCINVK